MADGKDLVAIFGASGFVGRHTVSALAKRGFRIRAAERRPDLAGHLQPMGGVGQIHAVQANLRYPDSIRRAVEGARVVVNTVGVLAPSGRQTFEAVHVEGAEAVAKAAKAAGVERLIHISAIGADPKSKANYARTKGEGERAVLAQFPGAIIVRPSIVFGPEDQFFNRFAGLARISPFLPLIGGGDAKFQPVYVGDLASAIANAAPGLGAGSGTGLGTGFAKPGTVYEIGGPEVKTFRQLLYLVQDYTGRHRPFLPMPFWLAKLQALATWPLPNALRPLTVDQVRLLKTDNIVSDQAKIEGRDLAGLGVADPATIAALVPGYLERFHPKGQYAHYRS